MHRNLLLNLLRAVYWYSEAVRINMAAEADLQVSKAASFLLLNIAQGEHRATNIARNLGVSRQAVGQMLTDLCNRGILTSREDPNNRRSRIVAFAPAFADRGGACAEIMLKLEYEISRRVGPDDFKAMARALSFDWGAYPTFARLSRDELRHGKEVWREEFMTESAHNDTPIAQGYLRTDAMIRTARRDRSSRPSGSTTRTRKVAKRSNGRSSGRKRRQHHRNP